MVVNVPRPHRYMSLQMRDWDNIANEIEACKISFNLWSAINSVLFGIGITAILSIWPILATGGSSGLIIAYVAISCVALGAAVPMVAAARQFTMHNTSQITKVISTMAEYKREAMDSEQTSQQSQQQLVERP